MVDYNQIKSILNLKPRQILKYVNIFGMLQKYKNSLSKCVNILLGQPVLPVLNKEFQHVSIKHFGDIKIQSYSML